MNIFLCGLPTVGKTRFGQVLAQYLSFPFFDTDDLILHSYGENQYPSIKKFFRQLEKKLSLLGKSLFFVPYQWIKVSSP